MQDIDIWQAEVNHICGDFLTIPNPDIPFIGDIHLNTHGGLDVAHISTNASRVRHAHHDGQDDRYCFLIYQTSGIMGYRKGRTSELELRAGEMALLDSSSTFDMVPQGLIDQISVHLQREQVQAILHRGEGIEKISQSSFSGQMLRNMMQQLSFENNCFSARDDDGKALQQALIALLKPSLMQASEEGEKQPLLIIADQYIQRMLANPALTPEWLADQMDISRRTLYRLFESRGETVAQYILRQRLERCALDLRQQGGSIPTITEIAFRWGFSDVSQFSRAFKRIKGMTPRDWRISHSRQFQ